MLIKLQLTLTGDYLLSSFITRLIKMADAQKTMRQKNKML